ncbi:MAG TPA: hypothetical protein VIG33_16735 [Pseudobdellovibrionaceae bacterium]|jgi:integrase
MNRDSVKGSYYIRVSKSGWYVCYQFYKDGVRSQASVAKLAYRELGFKTEMSVDEAKERCKLLNAERGLIKDKIRVAAKRVTEIKNINETLFPTHSVEAFQELLKEENFGSEAHLEKLYSHFNFIQTMVNYLRLQPFEYKDNSKKIYKYFISKQISLNYSYRLLTVLNRWGKFHSKTTGQFYDDVKAPRGREQSAIADAQKTKSGKETELGVRTESLPLVPEKLQAAKDKLIPDQFNWLKISVWFGLRPEEVDLLDDDTQFRVEFNLKSKTKVLHVYQPKLQSIPENKRWKRIPVVFKEQEECLELIAEGNFERPLNKTIRKHCGQGITCYGGRKNFVDMMLDKGQRIEDISLWLGHTSIETTWKHYKNRQTINFIETAETSVSK